MTSIRHLAATLVLACTLPLTIPAYPQQPAPSTAPSASGEGAGHVGTLCGVVVDISCSSDDGDLSLHIDGDRRFLVPAAERPRLGQRLGRFLQQPLCATGVFQTDALGYSVQARAADLVEKLAANSVSPFHDAFTTCETGVTLPRVTRQVSPPYPLSALQEKKAGAVLVQLVVLPTGRAGVAVVTRSADKEQLDVQALLALKQWRFKPGTWMGKPVPVIVSVEMNFLPGRH